MRLTVPIHCLPLFFAFYQLAAATSSKLSGAIDDAEASARLEAQREVNRQYMAKYRQNPANREKVRGWSAKGQRVYREKKFDELTAQLGDRKEARHQFWRAAYARQAKHHASLPLEVQKERTAKRAAYQRKIYLQRKERKRAEIHADLTGTSASLAGVEEPGEDVADAITGLKMLQSGSTHPKIRPTKADVDPESIGQGSVQEKTRLAERQKGWEEPRFIDFLGKSEEDARRRASGHREQ